MGRLDNHHFWFSQKQKDLRVKDSLPKIYCRINGEIKEYSECSEHKEPGCNWEDAIYLGQGNYKEI